MAVEISRRDNGNGTTEVTVGIGATGQAILTVNTYALDQPGYRDMIDAFVAKQEMIHNIVHGKES